MGERPLGRTDFSGPDACEMYANVVRARRFDGRALARQRQGWLHEYASVRGREAAQVGAAFASTPADALFPTRRSDALRLARGVPPADLLASYRGGPAALSPDASVFPRTSTTGSGLPVAVGAGMARDYAGEDGVALAVLDARATSEGDFHEACNFAGVFEVPCVFFCENDGRGPTRDARATTGPTVAEMATAYGFEGVRVDGTDALAVAEVVAAARADAREGSPVLVEAVTGGADRAGDERRGDAANDGTGPGSDPLVRLETYLEEAGVVDDAFATETREAADAELDRAVATAASTTADPDEMFEHAYADLPSDLRAQRSRAGAAVDADESS
jgi:pyruvate dehydrogenase E1 component alpha subunit